MIAYLVAPTPESGIKEALSRGWTQIAWVRFATPGNHDVRVVWRASEMVPFQGVTPMLRGADYDIGPVAGEGELAERIILLRADSEAATELAAGDKGMALTANKLAYETGLLEKWAKERRTFDEFVASGHGEWVEI